MLMKLEDMPSYVAAFKAVGEVTKEDYNKTVIPEIERVDRQHGHIHFLMVMETSVKDFSLGAWLKDVATGFKHYRGWKKIAIVTDEKGAEKFTDLVSVFIPGSAKGFSLPELQEAKKWVAEE
jgi:hypothetical protein